MVRFLLRTPRDHICARAQPRVSLLCLALILGACYPSPHLETRSPHVTGTILRGDEPLAHRNVALSIESRDSTCGKPVATSKTDVHGDFEFDGIRRFVPRRLHLTCELERTIQARGLCDASH